MQRVLYFFRRKLCKAQTTLLDLPNELLLQIAGDLRLKDLNSLHRTTRFFTRLLLPVLLRSTVNVRGRNNRSLLHWASSNGRYSLMILLLQHGAQANINTLDYRGVTPLHSAVLSRNVECVKILLQNRADTEIKNTDG